MICHDFPSGLKKVVVLDRCDSTNTFIKMNRHRFKDNVPLLVTSKIQTGGRGRNQRTWFSPPGKGLYTSFAFLIETKRNLPFLPLISGITVIELLKALCGIEMDLKWPNDITFRQKKIAGILIENNLMDSQMFCIAGFGINLNHMPEDWPSPLDKKAISLKMITGGSFPLEKVNPLLSSIFLDWIQKLQETKYKLIIETALRYSQSFLDKEISFAYQDRIMKGIFKGINRDGALILNTGPHQSEFYYNGEILL